MEEIDLKELLNYGLKKVKIFLIILASVIGLGSIYTLFLQKPTYQSYATIVLGSNESKTITQSDVNLNKNLVDSYTEIVKSRLVLDQVNEELNYGYSYGELAGKISVSDVNNTEIIKISVTESTPVRAKDIANTTAEIFTKEVKPIYKIDNITILDRAIENDKPSNAGLLKQEIIYTLIGAFLGAGTIFVMFYFDRSVKTAEQVESATKLPILGQIRKTSRNLDKNELIVKTNPKSNISEDIRTVRTNLQFSLASNKAQTVLITSSNPQEGKSFTSSNLAVAMAQSGKSTLVVDCDLRLGRVHEIFDITNSAGLSNMLADHKTAKFVDYAHKTKIKNLAIITRGTVPPNPSELLNSADMERFIKTVKRHFDYIIFDGAPVNGLSDSLVVAKKVDKTIVVCSTNTTTIDELSKAIKSLSTIDAKVAGVVLNRVVDKKNKKYGYYTNSYYTEAI